MNTFPSLLKSAEDQRRHELNSIEAMSGVLWKWAGVLIAFTICAALWAWAIYGQR